MPYKATDDCTTLNDQEKHLIAIIRDTKFGELKIHVAEGKPIRVEEIKKSIKL